MILEPNTYHNIYYAGRIRKALITALVKNQNVIWVIWKYRPGIWGWSDENSDTLDHFKKMLGEEITSVEI